MSKQSWKTFKAAVASLGLAVSAVALVGIPTAAAQEENPTLSVNVARELGEAIELSNTDQFAQAITVIDNLLAQRSGSMQPYELATAYEIRGTFKVNIENYAGALADFERALAQGGLPEARERQVRFNVAQLYFQEERFAEAARFLQEYISFAQSSGQEVDANTYYLLGASYYATENFRQARRPLETALRLLTEPKKAYYDLMNAVYNELGAESERGDLLVTMINYWPEDSSYWGQLAGAYSQAGRDADAATVLELGYKAGIITNSGQILSLIQYYSVLDNPIRGAELLEKEMASGNIERTQKNLELLAQLYNLAREQKKALVPLREAAQLSGTGELFYRLGQVYFADEQWRNAEQALVDAVNKGGLSGRQLGDAWLLIGNARFNQDTNSPRQRRRAIEAFRRSTNYSTSRTAAQGWITYIRAIINTEQRQCDVELLQAIERYKNGIQRCETIVDVFRRVGPTGSITQEAVDECNRFTASSIDEANGTITFEDGTTEAGPACKAGATAPASEDDATEEESSE